MSFLFKSFPEFSVGSKKEEFSNLPHTVEESLFLEEMIYGKRNKHPEHIYLGIRANKDELYRIYGNNIDKQIKKSTGLYNPGVVDLKQDNQSSVEQSEKNIKNKYQIVHFSVHGIFHNEKPELNALVLTSRKQAEAYRKTKLNEYEENYGKIKKQDGFLRLGEIIELGIDAELIVMSACETSLGTIMTGEGMVGLPQAFLIGGSKNVLSTLWKVDEKGTMEFFKLFYPKILRKCKGANCNVSKKNNTSPSSILRATQLEMMNQKGEYSDPFYWSPFVIYGE